MLPDTTHQAGREGWRIRVICKCGRSGEITPADLLARRDRPISDLRYRCSREGCRMGRDGHFIPPGYVEASDIRFVLPPQQPRRVDHMAKFMQLMGVAWQESLREQLAAVDAREARIATWRRAP